MNQIDSEKIRLDFPTLLREIKPGIPLIYLDSTATSQKPSVVLNAMDVYYQQSNANIHRGIHTLAEESTAAYEEAREKVKRFIHAPSAKSIIFTRNTTESINLVAQTWGRANLSQGDVIILTEMEHHSNLVPWQILAAELNLRLEFIPVTKEGLLDMVEYQSLLQLEPRLVAFSHMSNVLGTVNPAKDIIRFAHHIGAVTLVDAAQSVPHLPVDASDLDADFLAFSGHKMCGPTGIGVLFGKTELLESMPPFLGGGDMIKRVELRSFVPNSIPHKFEAGTPAIAEAIGLGAAIDYLDGIGMEAVAAYEHEIIDYAMKRLEKIPGLWIFGPESQYKGGVASFTLDDIHPHDIAQVLDGFGIAVRAGHHCAMPLHQKYNLPATTRASFYLYNTKAEADRLVDGLYHVKDLFG